MPRVRAVVRGDVQYAYHETCALPWQSLVLQVRCVMALVVPGCGETACGYLVPVLLTSRFGPGMYCRQGAVRGKGTGRQAVGCARVFRHLALPIEKHPKSRAFFGRWAASAMRQRIIVR